MRKKEEVVYSSAKVYTVSALLGGFISLGISIILIFFVSLTVSKGLIADYNINFLTSMSCLIGSFAGAYGVIKRCKTKKIIIGLSVGVVMAMLLVIIGMITYSEIAIEATGGIELCTVMIGSVLAGAVASRPQKRKRR